MWEAAASGGFFISAAVEGGQRKLTKFFLISVADF
jgi:hypothetical protein